MKTLKAALFFFIISSNLLLKEMFKKVEWQKST